MHTTAKAQYPPLLLMTTVIKNPLKMLDPELTVDYSKFESVLFYTKAHHTIFSG